MRALASHSHTGVEIYCDPPLTEFRHRPNPAVSF
jgi:hypothetical protein